jgi:hypothetical protein
MSNRFIPKLLSSPHNCPMRALVDANDALSTVGILEL